MQLDIEKLQQLEPQNADLLELHKALIFAGFASFTCSEITWLKLTKHRGELQPSCFATQEPLANYIKNANKIKQMLFCMYQIVDFFCKLHYILKVLCT